MSRAGTRRTSACDSRLLRIDRGHDTLHRSSIHLLSYTRGASVELKTELGKKRSPIVGGRVRIFL